MNRAIVFKLTVLLLLFYTASFIFHTDSSFEQDLGRHLASGRLIFESKQVPYTNLFSYTYPDFPFIDHHWLFQLLTFLGQNYLSLPAVVLIKQVLLLLAVFLVLTINQNLSPSLLLVSSFIFLHTMRERVELRPEIFSFLFTTLTLWVLEKYPHGRWAKLVWILPLIQLFWVNTHIYFPLGILIQGVFLLDSLFGKDYQKVKVLGLILLFSTVTSLINPNGLAGTLYPLQVFHNYGYQIVENQTFLFLEKIGFHDPNYLFAKISIISALIVVFLGLTLKKVQLRYLLLNLLGIALSLLNVRSLPYLVFLSLPATLQLFANLRLHLRGATITLYFLFASLLIYESINYLNGNYYRYQDRMTKPELRIEERGKKAMDFLITHNLPSNIFNNFDIGSYITYRTYPKYRVFVDGRPEAYPSDFFNSVYIPVQQDQAKFNQLAQQLNIQTVVMSHTDQTPWGKSFLKTISADPNWKPLFLDDFIVIFTRAINNYPALKIDRLSVGDFDYTDHTAYLYLSLFFFNISHPDQGVEFARKALQLFPDSPAANQILGSQSQKRFWW